MKPSDAATLLAKIAVFDRRTLGESDALAWAEALDGKVTLQDAMTAVTEHFRTSHDWLMPDRIITLAREIRRKRINAAGYPDLPNDLTQAQERAWLKVWHESVGLGNPPLAAQMHADRSLEISPRVAAASADPDRVKELLKAAGIPKSLPYTERAWRE